MRHDVYIALGSNVGDRLGMIAAALVALEAEEGTRVERVSHVYESEPWGVIEQPPFANAVALVSFEGSAEELLDILHRVEAGLGRVRAEPNAPRTIDLDILLFDDEEWDSARLRIPHPRMRERDFVVTPLLEVAPDVTMPDGEPVDPAWATLGRVVGVLGVVPGYEGVTVAGDALLPGAASAEGDEWVPVGPRRFERNAPNTSTDFDLLFYESVLQQDGIPCRFDPHRPNEGFATFPGFAQSVRLMVPASRAAEAQALIDRVSTTPPQPPV